MSRVVKAKAVNTAEAVCKTEQACICKSCQCLVRGKCTQNTFCEYHNKPELREAFDKGFKAGYDLAWAWK